MKLEMLAHLVARHLEPTTTRPMGTLIESYSGLEGEIIKGKEQVQWNFLPF
jgi:hypothetical protein